MIRFSLGLVSVLPLVQADRAKAQQPAATTLQEDFNTASQAVEDGKCAIAIPIFARLESDARLKPGSLPAAAVSVRHGRCLLTGGEVAAGEFLIQRGLPVLEKAGADFADEVSQASMQMGWAAHQRYDHDAAVMWFTRASQSQSLSLKLMALMRLAQVTSFDGDGAAIATVDKAMALISGTDKKTKATQANFLSVRARALMNLGRDKEAAADLKRALDLSGGLSLRASLDDVSLRSDLAQVMLLTNRRDEARNYLAYTGAGRIEQSPFVAATYMDVPDCGADIGLRPADSAIVEFSIGDDGRVVSAQTVYSRGNFAVASAFAASVRDWVWQPEAIAKLPAFYRYLTRVEVRCSNGSGRQPGLWAPLHQRYMAWVNAVAKVSFEAPAEGAANRTALLATLRKAAALHEAEGNNIAAAALIGAVAMLVPVGSAEGARDIDRALALLDQADPRRADATLLLPRAALAAERLGAGNPDTNEASREKREAAARALFAKALADPLVIADPLALNTVRVAAASRSRGKYTPEQIDLLHTVADDARLEEGHPLRQIAQLRLANLAAEQKRFTEAQTLFARTGLTEQQCALIGDIPRMKADHAGSDDYPQEALIMGFEGWVRLEFDIDASGHTANQRTLIAYPPFVFADAASSILRNVRYDPSYRPAGKLACSASSQTVKFAIPSNH